MVFMCMKNIPDTASPLCEFCATVCYYQTALIMYTDCIDRICIYYLRSEGGIVFSTVCLHVCLFVCLSVCLPTR